MSHLPFLRSPPFPWVDAAIAAVSGPGASNLVDPDAVIAALRRARVGGAFWDGAWDGDADDVTAWLRDGTGDGQAMRTTLVAMLEAAVYRDPFTGSATDAAGAIAILARWRDTIDANRGIAAAVGMAAWKRDAIAQFLWDGRTSPPCRSADAAVAKAQGAIAYWPSRSPTDLAARAANAGAQAWQIEDGFLRSTGLGAECRPPMSVLIDRTGGIHFDPAQPSELETILATHAFDAALLSRARALRHAIVAGRIGKYGVDRGGPIPDLPADRRVVLAIGQVEDDLSVLRGGADVAGAHDFLRRVRAVEPDALIVYRPHPDVAAGLRRGERDGGGVADRVATGGSLLALVERADALHVLSSLTGFEALLRDKAVTVHGVPFYSGWGLTIDLAPQPKRRGRRLTRDALVAAALILAPRYRDPVTQLPCTPEVLVERMIAAPAPETTMLTGFRRALGATRRTLAAADRWRA